MSGKLPAVNTGLASVATEHIRNALFSKIQRDLADEPFEMLATAEALTNALTGESIPRTPGIAGGSAFSRLSRVFPPEIMEALQSGKIDDLINARAPTPIDPVPIPDQGLWNPYQSEGLLETPPGIGPVEGPVPPRTERLLDVEEMGASLADVPEGATPVDFPESSAALRSPTGQAGLGETPPTPVSFPAAKSRAERTLDTETFATSLAAPPDPNLAARLPVDVTLDDVTVKQAYLMDPPGRNLIRQYAKEGWLTAIDLGNLIRANLTTVDISWLRQQAFLIFGNPVEFSAAMRDSVRSIFSAEYARNIDKAIRLDKLTLPSGQVMDLFDFYSKIGGDFLRPLDSRVAGQWQAAEDFMILALTEGQARARPIQRFAEKLPWIRISGRAHITGTNVMNWRIFKKHVEDLFDIQRQIGKGQITGKRAENFNLDKSAATLAAFLAETSGRGPLGPLKGLSPALNAGFFSARLMIGRLISPRHLFSADPFIRKLAWKNFGTAMVGFSSLILGGYKAGLWDVEFDNRSADFMKIRIGRTRIDVWGGFQQYAVLWGRLIRYTLTQANLDDGSLKSTVTGETSEKDPVKLVGTLLRGKVAPGLGLALEAWTGRDFKGSKIDRRDWRRWLKRGGIPLAGMDIYEALEAEGLVGLSGASGIIGAGVQTYELPRWPELDAYYDIGEDKEPSDAQKLRKRYRIEHPDHEAKLFIRGTITRLSTGQARLRVKSLMAELKINPKNVPGFGKEFGNTLGGQDGLELPPRGAHPLELPPKGASPGSGRPQAPAPSIPGVGPIRLPPRSTPTPTSRWLEVRPDLNAATLTALNKVWFERGRLTRAEERQLRTVFDKHPFGQTNFNTWMKQTLRQIHQVATLAA